MILEHYALAVEIELDEFVKRFEDVFELPAMSFDCENETEWAEVVKGRLTYNVSRPYLLGTLHVWDPSVPAGCNFGVSFGLSTGDGQFSDEDISRFGDGLAKAFRTTTYYHRTWFGPGQNVERTRVFTP